MLVRLTLKGRWHIHKMGKWWSRGASTCSAPQQAGSGRQHSSPAAARRSQTVSVCMEKAGLIRPACDHIASRVHAVLTGNS
eukprot:COSAG01_NODE_913_length_12779_cov_9.134385_7_plen_81_part_00